MSLAEPLNNTSNTTTNIHDEESKDVMEDRFACNICFESVTSPVVTRCGHLYCWPCLYVWLEPGMTFSERQYLDSSYNTYIHDNRSVNTARRMCPVCKSTCSVKELVPIYVRECNVAENSNEKQQEIVTNSSAESVSNNHNSGNNVNQHEDELYASIDDEFVEVDEIVALDGHGNEDGDAQVTIELNEVSERSDDVNITTGATTGLRRRRPHQQQQLTGTTTTTTRTTAQTSSDPVPARPPPPPSTVQPVSATTTRSQNMQSMTIRPPIELHQSLFEALMTVQNRSHQSPYQTSSSDRPIPSIHDRNANNNGDGTRNDSSHYYEGNQMHGDQDPATEFLSRLLLMLGCFVVLCLLLF